MYISINTAQNVNIACKPASLVHRIGATMIDLATMGGILLLMYYLPNFIPGTSEHSHNLFMGGVLILLLGYHLLFELLLKGQSPGKMIFRLRVVRLDGQKLSFWDCMLRWSLRILDITASLGIVAMSSIIISSRMQRLGDLAAGTIVILEHPSASLQPLDLFTSPEGYEVTYPQVTLLSDKDISILKEVLKEVEQTEEYRLLEPLAQRIKEVTGIESSQNNLKFAQTVLQDYLFLTR